MVYVSRRIWSAKRKGDGELGSQDEGRREKCVGLSMKLCPGRSFWRSSKRRVCIDWRERELFTRGYHYKI